MIVGDEPRSWLEEPKSRARRAAPKSTGTPDAPTLPAKLPTDLDGLRSWLLSTDSIGVPEIGRQDTIGDPASGLMILVDMPDRADTEAGTLLSSDTGLLFDRMLAAIGRDRASTYIAALSPARITGGAIDANSLEMLGRIAKHHVALAQPERLLVMGDAPSRVFCGSSLNESRGSKHNFNHDGGTVSVTATFHPRFLLQQPRLKAQSWKDLQMMTEGMTA
ncbi:uracil-DNA glycosylase family protein [Parasphingopyxis lamellibrachiae]|uniref:DNA polymerase n=1 Tax=Parasphingopyxis lamellibrachiae TaxID=680125 RepID=A0A3D9FC79_9SPHN|nr:uracil-DNA glycosylase family protein [Parasphingopyxis lamellibrachiae]RED15420.1 DNA polymerase [Parasphingopyxis lamellibrachiae]